jgi:hypothetical protein
MPQKDMITPAKTISKELTYDQKQLYQYLKKWFGERHYTVVELDYAEKVTPENQRVYSFTWYTEKRSDDNTKLSIDLSYEATVENVEVETSEGSKKVAQKGEVSVTFQGYIQKDTENEWPMEKEKAHRRLMREIYDQFVIKGRYSQIESKLKRDLKAIMSDLKTYLKTHRYD